MQQSRREAQLSRLRFEEERMKVTDSLKQMVVIVQLCCTLEIYVHNEWKLVENTVASLLIISMLVLRRVFLEFICANKFFGQYKLLCLFTTKVPGNHCDGVCQTITVK